MSESAIKSGKGEFGLPDGVLNIVHGTNDIVNAICDDDDIRAISFVGSNTPRIFVLLRRCLFDSDDELPLVNLETSLKNYVSVPGELAVSLCIVQFVIIFSRVCSSEFKNLQKSLLIYQWGKMKANQVGSFSSRPGSIDYDSGRFVEFTHNQVLWLGMAFLAIAGPSLPCFLGILARFPGTLREKFCSDIAAMH
ncbi:hypothetical protein LOK49_LG13G02029 [Camellia lanceoleosa]|uniref:Uncharacterized protein n=1 Tax=Camellia lanceoleosa TaxID=1840588 RepID=A0ACC0FMC3_9ERIC|nr:hypothetical protein LOK49_LG13G02029 [Camellia lanceoleosa]